MDAALRDLVVELDGLLTGKPVDAARNAAHRSNLFVDPVTFVTEVASSPYHIADGGFSRLLIGDVGQVAGLDSVSLAGPKARWPDGDVQAVVSRLASVLSEACAAVTENPSRRSAIRCR